MQVRRVSPARDRQKSRRGARIRPTLLERLPTPEPTRSGSNPDSIFREGCSCSESRRSWPAEPWMAERRQLRTSEGLEGRNECSGTGHGQLRPTLDVGVPPPKPALQYKSSRAAHLVPNRIGRRPELSVKSVVVPHPDAGTVLVGLSVAGNEGVLIPPEELKLRVCPIEVFEA